ncbi:hypothetical protein DFA_01935 [Cavenderia fasciculata]|uniref:EF-hand domain-containing protein n=1 Tax=Cavenderia fasciculata TaxID=261658 RepID=F4PQT8_CACFS|nr:uncharacterized protein DFA_01935 [Cavenderia fasciculata]EGG22046.1 hypothetical protein DFA_01935 [Cavenderia fasciculata]|eukprot:XP_004359897.1 hypothetical protein DFA_01935 [Cavenderia fasciculata]
MLSTVDLSYPSLFNGTYYKPEQNYTISYPEMVRNLRKSGNRTPIDTALAIFAELDKNHFGYITTPAQLFKLRKNTLESFGYPDLNLKVQVYLDNFLRPFSYEQFSSKDQSIHYEDAVHIFTRYGSPNPMMQADLLFALCDRDKKEFVTLNQLEQRRLFWGERHGANRFNSF